MGKYLTGWPAAASPRGDTAPPSPYSVSTPPSTAMDDVDASVPPPSLPYDLLAVVNHSGSMAQGHYTAFVKEIGKWFRFDDTWVREVDEEEVLASEAYILFYFQRGAEASWRPPSPPSPMPSAPSPSSSGGAGRS